MLRLVAQSLHRHCSKALKFQNLNVHNTATEALEREIREVQIPVPWGHIAGKWWGPENVKPLLCIHGYQDNAESWDTLVPLLPPEVSLLAVDLPGHGYSSHFPRGTPYHALDFVLSVRRISNYYGWDKISLLGHSFGSVISFLYSALYPEHVEHYIGIDAIKPLSVDPSKRLKQQSKHLDHFLEIDSLDANTRRSYTYEAAVDHLHKSIGKWATREACDVLSRRGTVKLEDGNYRFSRDPRLKYFVDLGTSHSLIMAFAANVRCKILFVKANQGLWFETPEIFKEFLDVVKISATCFEHQFVDGLHHVHMDYPQRIAPLISKFLKK